MSQGSWGGFGILRPEPPHQRPALPPQPVPQTIRQYPQGYQGFLDVLNRAVIRWGSNKRYNEGLWSPLEWREAWLRIITPDWWEVRLKGGRPSIKAIMKTLEIQVNADIHDGDFPSVERAIKNGLDPATVYHEGSSESWLRSLTAREIYTWSETETSYLREDPASLQDYGNLTNYAVGHLVQARPREPTWDYVNWCRGVKKSAIEQYSHAFGNDERRAQIVGVLRACYKMVQQTWGSDSAKEVEANLLIESYLPTVEQFHELCQRDVPRLHPIEDLHGAAPFAQLPHSSARPPPPSFPREPSPLLRHAQLPPNYEVFLQLLNHTVERWGPGSQYNSRLWTPADWRKGWIEVVTPERWYDDFRQAGQDAILAVLRVENPRPDIHCREFPSIDRSIELWLKPQNIHTGTRTDSWLRSLAKKELSAWIAKNLSMLPPKGSNLGEAKLQSLRGEAFVKLNKACPDQTGDIYAEWLERISVIAEEAFWTGDASRRLRIIGVLGACWKMVHETQKHEDRERVGAYMLVDSYLPSPGEFKHLCLDHSSTPRNIRGLALQLPPSRPKRLISPDVNAELDSAFKRPALPSSSRNFARRPSLSQGHPQTPESASSYSPTVSSSPFSPTSTVFSPHSATFSAGTRSAYSHSPEVIRRPTRTVQGVSQSPTSRLPPHRHKSFSQNAPHSSTGPSVVSSYNAPPRSYNPPTLSQLVARICGLYSQHDHASIPLIRTRLDELSRLADPLSDSEHVIREYLDRFSKRDFRHLPSVAQIPTSVQEARQCNTQKTLEVELGHDFNFDDLLS